MHKITNLRCLRYRYHISLGEIEAVSGFSNQYISCAELGKIRATSQLTGKMDTAIELLIANRKQELLLLEADFLKYRGRLLEAAEERENERDILHTD